VNLRSGPGISFGIMATVPTNTSGLVLGYPVAANGYVWNQVSMNGFPVGWLAANYLTKTGMGSTATPTRTVTRTLTTTPTRTPTVGTTTPTRTPTTDLNVYQPGEEIQTITNLHLRSGPGSNNPSLGIMPSGTTGAVTGAPQLVGSVLWYPVDMEGFGAGWASGQYLTNVITASLEPTETVIPTEIVVAEPTLTPIATEVIVPPTETPTETPPEEVPPTVEEEMEGLAEATP
jgi:uncharacterized protein YraI